MCISVVLMCCGWSCLKHHIILINVSGSMPRGVWVRSLGGGPIGRGDVVALDAPALAREYGCVREHQVLLKQVVALEGDHVCIGLHGDVSANALVGTLPSPRPAPHALAWAGCRQVGHGELFVAGSHERSCDSRYFGLVSHGDVVSKVWSLYTLESTDGLEARMRAVGGGR